MHLFFFPLQLLTCVRKDGWKYPSKTEWWSALSEKVAANAKISKVGPTALISDKSAASNSLQIFLIEALAFVTGPGS